MYTIINNKYCELRLSDLVNTFIYLVHLLNVNIVVLISFFFPSTRITLALLLYVSEIIAHLVLFHKSE